MAVPSKIIATEVNEFTFVSITGEGVDNFDGDAKIYKVVQKVTKKEGKRIRKEILDFWNENKDPKWPEEPKNFKNITFENKEGDLCISAYSQAEFDNRPVKIALVDAKRNPLDMETYGNIGAGSTGSIAIKLKPYKSGQKSGGVSMFLSAVQLVNFVPRSDTNGTDAFDTVEGAEGLSESDTSAFEGEKKKKKKKKKKK